MLLIDEVLSRPHGYGTPKNAWRADRAKSAAALFAELVKIEPRLGQLLADAQRFKRQSRGKRRICANDRWYGYFEWRGKGLKARLCRLVGEEAEIPELRTVDAYDVAYHYIYRTLPDCRQCGCL